MPQYFVNTQNIQDKTVKITEKQLVHHIANVLRIKIGEELLLIDENRTAYKTVVSKINRDSITAVIKEKEKSNNILNTQIYLAQGVLKNEMQNLVVQKAAELGVKGILPFCADNTQVKSTIIDSKIKKWEKIAAQAAAQCERADLPEIFERRSLEEILNDDTFKIKIACVERCEDETLKKCLLNSKIKQEDKILLIIGPEGGFSQSENALFNKYRICKATLGKMILRAETAAIFALSIAISELENGN